MDPQSAVGEIYLSLDREDFRRDIEGMGKTGVEIVGLKRKRFHLEIGSCSVVLADKPVVAPKHARSLAKERSRPTAPAACKIDLTLDSDSDDDDDCVITGFVMPQIILPRTPADCNNPDDDDDDDECVIVGARAGCNVVQVTHDSIAIEDDNECVMTGWLSPRAVFVRNFEFVHDEVRASEAEAESEFSDFQFSVGIVPASVSARESDDEFNYASESDVGSSASEFDAEFSVPEWDEDDENCWGWLIDDGNKAEVLMSS